MSTLLMLLGIFVFLCCFRLAVRFRWGKVPASPGRLERGETREVVEEIGFRDPFRGYGGREREMEKRDLANGVGAMV